MKLFRAGLLLGILLLPFVSLRDLSARENLQRFLDALMRGRQGAAIVARPITGEVLAVWNRHAAFETAFPPGSTAKLVPAAAALEEGVISEKDRIFCRRVPELLGEPYHCSHPQASEPYTLSLALANSCNYFFATLSARLSPTVLAHWYAVFGFGATEGTTGSRAPAAGIRFGDSEVGKARAVLGEGPMVVTPAQLLLAYSVIATRGTALSLWEPRTRRTSVSSSRRVKLFAETFDVLAEGLEECVRDGTGHAAAVPGVRIAGKTGTAAALDGSGTTHAWFVGYGPAEKPEIALVVFLMRGTGARDGAPLAGQILRHYFSSKNLRP